MRPVIAPTVGWMQPVGDPSIEARDVEVVAGSPGDWVRAAGDGALTFRTTRQRRDQLLVPLNRLFGQRYAVYWKVERG